MRNFKDKVNDCFNDMIDDRCETFGIINTIQFLLDAGFNKEELVNYFGFEEEDVITALEADGEFDDWRER